MEPKTVTDPQSEKIQLVKALTLFRMAVISLFLGMLAIFQVEFGELRFPFVLFSLVAATYATSIFYLLFIKQVARYQSSLFFQLFLDLAIETAIIHYAGGLASPFTFLYMFTIIASAVVLPRPSSYVIASAASIVYGVMGNLEFYQVLVPAPLLISKTVTLSAGFAFFTILSHIAAFFLVAYLSDIFSERVRLHFLAHMSKTRDLINLQTFHENVIANMGSGFLALDLKKKVVSTNLAAKDILGLPTEAILGMDVNHLFPDGTALKILPVSVNGPADAINTKTTINTPSGARKKVAVTGSLLRDSSSKVIGYIIIFQDISRLRAMEEAVQRADRLASIGRISAGLAHEIRNPLGSISGSIQMLVEGGMEPERGKRLMSIIQKETNRLNSTINRFLNSAEPFASREAGVVPARIIEEAVELFKNDERFSGVTVETGLETNESIYADPEALKQVIWNLLINAAQAMDGTGTINVSVSLSTKDEKHFCTILVSDTGKGIAPEYLDRIFEPFYTTKEKGTGLGLSTVFKIIEQHDGTIAVESAPGKGSWFIINLPTGN